MEEKHRHHILPRLYLPGQERFFDIPEKYVKQLNQRTANNSRQLFYHRSEEWIAKILNRGNYSIYLLDLSGSLQTLWKNRDEEIVLTKSAQHE